MRGGEAGISLGAVVGPDREALVGWAWLLGTLYVMRDGAAENPYAAEDAEIAGACALIRLPPALAALARLVYRVVIYHRERIDR